jgi:hypothetical protein
LQPVTGCSPDTEPCHEFLYFINDGSYDYGANKFLIVLKHITSPAHKKPKQPRKKLTHTGFPGIFFFTKQKLVFFSPVL